MFRFTIRFLLALTAAVGVAVAVLRYPAKFSTVITFSASVSLLTAAVIGAMTSRGSVRAFCVGFAIAGWLHAVLAFTTWFDKGTSQLLISTYFLERLAPVFGNELAPRMAIEEPLISASAHFVPGSPPARYYKYIVTGQSLFTLMIGAVGGSTGAYFYQRSAAIHNSN